MRNPDTWIRIAAAIAAFALSASAANADSARHADGIREASSMREATLLAPEIPEGRPATMARGMFHRVTVGIEVSAGSVTLAATTDGTGRLRTDDQAQLVVERPDGTRREWLHDFRSQPPGRCRRYLTTGCHSAV